MSQMCKVSGCQDQHARHYCRKCGNDDSDHFSTNCPHNGASNRQAYNQNPYMNQQPMHQQRAHGFSDFPLPNAPYYHPQQLYQRDFYAQQDLFPDIGRHCRVTGCQESHPAHVCRKCSNPDSDHFSSDCPVSTGASDLFPDIGRHCRVTGCQESHPAHVCRKCSNPDSDHFSSDCPVSTGTSGYENGAYQGSGGRSIASTGIFGPPPGAKEQQTASSSNDHKAANQNRQCAASFSLLPANSCKNQMQTSNTHVCPYCGSSFSKLEELVAHFDSDHSDSSDTKDEDTSATNRGTERLTITFVKPKKFGIELQGSSNSAIIASIDSSVASPEIREKFKTNDHIISIDAISINSVEAALENMKKGRLGRPMTFEIQRNAAIEIQTNIQTNTVVKNLTITFAKPKKFGVDLQGSSNSASIAAIDALVASPEIQEKLKTNDQIISIDGILINSAEAAIENMKKARLGRPITFEIQRHVPVEMQTVIEIPSDKTCPQCYSRFSTWDDLIAHCESMHSAPDASDKNNVVVSAASPTNETCAICFQEKIDVAFDPCGHMVCCRDCGLQCADCPICRRTISKTLKVFR